jgi:glucose-6-phosphate isomerase
MKPSSQNLNVDFALALTQGTSQSPGVTYAQLLGAQPRFEAALASVLGRVQKGELGFWRLPTTQTQSIDTMKAVANSLPTSIKDVLVLGIGGSSLGGRALCHALVGSLEVPQPATPQNKRIYFVDNSDPWFFHQLLQQLSAHTTLVIAISKSGGTVETAAQLLVAEHWLKQALGTPKAKRHVVLITDPSQGSLRAKAVDEELLSLEIPSNVGGRFSALTPVGLFPAHLAGVNIPALLSGAQAMASSCAAKELIRNPAGILAVLHVLHHEQHNRNIHVMMPYADALRPFAAWYVQLWAESLGKRLDVHGQVVHQGPTPLAAVGATDQHSQLQLFAEGPQDKLITFIVAETTQRDLSIPEASGELAYLKGKSLHGVLNAEQRATAVSLANHGRPSITLRIPRIDASALGALCFLYEAATAFAGELYEVNAFDQPGVETSKLYASALLERPGFSQYSKDLDQVATPGTTDYTVGCPLP